MIDLTKTTLPESVEIGGKRYKVQTSFKYWLRFLETLAVKESKYMDFDFIYISDKPPNRIEGFVALVQFCNPPQELPRSDGGDGGEKAVDYGIDADYIYAAFMEQYGIDIIESDMHWYKFQSLFKGLHGTKLNEIIGYRLWENTSGKRDAYTRGMEKMKAAWELPQESDEKDEDLRAFEAKIHPNGQ